MARVRHYGDCPACGHDWREHPGGALSGGETECGECGYEVEHGERAAGDVCTVAAAPAP